MFADAKPAERTRRIPGEQGTWVFIFCDLMEFAVFFAVFLHLRIADPEAFARDQTQLNQTFGALNTILLLVSSLFVVLATRAVVSGAQRRLAPWFIAGAFVLGVAFLVIKAVEYAQKIGDGVSMFTSDFFMFYYVLTGLHAVHVVAGLVALTGMFFLARRPEMSRRGFVFFEFGACFWHLVDLLWIAIFPLVFLVR